MKPLRNRLLAGLCLLSLPWLAMARGNTPDKREFRGVWMHTVYSGMYKALTPERIQDTLRAQLDQLRAMGFNAVLFQVRPEGDAFYASPYEPWSRYLTGTQGKAPNPMFDPMAFLVEECHKRSMEFHAWINPYRASANTLNKLADGHLYFSKRYLFLPYGRGLYYNPGVPENRSIIREIVKDIVSRYDIDAVHMDDYFYPYPLRGLPFPDNDTFKRYGSPAGYEVSQKDDWRRNNINLLIEEISVAIKEIKPWVRFGVSPFGIYRNLARDPDGSPTNGTSCYDDLYADVLLWMRNHWIDYVIPQLYWEIGHTNADYAALVKWWNDHAVEGVRMYIGQDVNRSRTQFYRKWELENDLARIDGNCYWNADALLQNKLGAGDTVARHHRLPAIAPTFPQLDSVPPYPPFNLRMNLMAEEPLLLWDAGDEPGVLDKTAGFAVYGFFPDEEFDLSREDRLITVTTAKRAVLPDDVDALCRFYIVTTLDRMHNESRGSIPYQFNELDQTEEEIFDFEREPLPAAPPESETSE